MIRRSTKRIAFVEEVKKGEKNVAPLLSIKIITLIYSLVKKYDTVNIMYPMASITGEAAIAIASIFLVVDFFSE